MTTETQLDVMIRVLAPCETWGKILVTILEDKRRSKSNDMSGYTVGMLKCMLDDKYGVQFKEDDLKEKCIAALIHEGLLNLVQTADKSSCYYNNTAIGEAWASAILQASADGDRRFIRYVRRSENGPRRARQPLLERMNAGTW